MRTARKLWSQLQWSEAEQCHYWTQDLYGRQSTYLDAVHGFVATAAPLIAGRDLLPADEWQAWQERISHTVLRTAEWDGPLANWRAHLAAPRGQTAMHGIVQTEQAVVEYGQWRHPLWTGDPGFAIYLLDCIEGTDRFPTLDVFFP